MFCFWFIYWSRQTQEQGAYPCLFLALMSRSKLRRSGITAFTPKILDTLSFADFAIMDREPQEVPAVSSMVSPPSPNPSHSIGPSSAQCPSLKDCISVHHSHLLPLRTFQQKMWYMLTWASGPSLRDWILPLPWAPCTPSLSPVSMRHST